ncbi:hypothetical protein KR044_010314 [Drosophila immigrans]|nr:hypothetical protein KR044_010314 [Drosophila immigrans]
MESINFNDFSIRERHEIIKAFLIKMRTANSMQSAHRFFEYYLKRFYKLPTKIIDDIIYCQRAMKIYLSVHQVCININFPLKYSSLACLILQRITNFYRNNTATDVVAKENHLLEIEDILHEINAECQYLVVSLEENIGRFCLPFTEQQMQPNVNLISDMVSEAIVPQVCASVLLIKPHFVAERPTESQLLRKYFTPSNSTDSRTPLNAKAESPKPTRIVPPNKKPSPAVASTPSAPPTAPRTAVKRAATPLLEVAIKNEAVNASRLNLQEALKRARFSQHGKPIGEPKMNNSQELFLQAFGLCTHSAYKSIQLSQTHRQKRKQKLVHK